MTNRFSHRTATDKPAADKDTTLTDAQLLFADVLGECIAAEWIRRNSHSDGPPAADVARPSRRRATRRSPPH